jgi:hypothetical protein
MHQASFIVRKSKLKTQLAKMHKALAMMYKMKTYTVLELTITDDLLTLVIPGIKLELPCKTVHTAKATFDFHYFYDIVKTWDGVFFECVVTDNQLQMGVTKVTAQTTFFEDDSILRSIKLPINYTDWHLLQLKQIGFTLEELRFNNLEFAVHHAKKRLKANTTRAKGILSIYGVTKQEIEDLIASKVTIG